MKTHCNEDLTFVHALYLNVPISLSGKNEIAVFVIEEGTMRRDCDVRACACERPLNLWEHLDTHFMRRCSSSPLLVCHYHIKPSRRGAWLVERVWRDDCAASQNTYSVDVDYSIVIRSAQLNKCKSLCLTAVTDKLFHTKQNTSELLKLWCKWWCYWK